MSDVDVENYNKFLSNFLENITEMDGEKAKDYVLRNAV